MTRDELAYLVPYQKRPDLIETDFYKDIDLTLTAHPKTRDLMLKINADAIKRSLRHIFMWRKWDIPFNPDYHNHIMDLLFELNTIFTQSSIRTRSEWLINNFEPRVTVKNIDVIPIQEDSGYEISIVYIIKEIRVEDNLNLYLKRVR